MSLQKLEEFKPGQNGVRGYEEIQPVNPKEVFAELFELLEEYGPTWYTEDCHRRAVAALRVLRGS